MRLFIEAPNGRDYCGADTEAIYLKETMIQDVEPIRCENPQQAAEIMADWFKNPDNIYCAFTLMTRGGNVVIFPPEILKRCIITVQAQTGELGRFIPKGLEKLGADIGVGSKLYNPGDHSSPGLGYVPEEELTEEEPASDNEK